MNTETKNQTLKRQAEARAERLAEQLRTNLQRRKQQSRARRAGEANEGTGLPASEQPGDAD